MQTDMATPTDGSTGAPDLTVLIATADAALRQGEYEAAVAALDRLVQVRPDDVRLLLNLGGALKELGRFEAAFAVLV